MSQEGICEELVPHSCLVILVCLGSVSGLIKFEGLKGRRFISKPKGHSEIGQKKMSCEAHSPQSRCPIESRATERVLEQRTPAFDLRRSALLFQASIEATVASVVLFTASLHGASPESFIADGRTSASDQSESSIQISGSI
ncbi:hypothetical protein QQ045_017114 [Rhodiola kirilowii]